MAVPLYNSDWHMCKRQRNKTYAKANHAEEAQPCTSLLCLGSSCIYIRRSRDMIRQNLEVMCVWIMLFRSYCSYQFLKR